MRQFPEEPRLQDSNQNAVRLNSWLEAACGDREPSVEDFREGFEALNSRGLLQTKRLPATPRPIVDPETMSYEELSDATFAESRGARPRIVGQPSRYIVGRPR